MPQAAFLRDHFAVQRPLLLANAPLQDQHIWAHWRKPDFLSRYGEDQGKMYASGTAAGMASVASFVELHMASTQREGEKPVFVVHTDRISSLAQDVKRPGM